MSAQVNPLLFNDRYAEVEIFVDGVRLYNSEDTAVMLVAPVGSNRVMIYALEHESYWTSGLRNGVPELFGRFLHAAVDGFTGTVLMTDTKISLFNVDGFVSINFDSSSILLDFIQAWKLAPDAPSVDDDSYSNDDGEDDEDSEEECVDYERLTFGVADLMELHESQSVPEGLDWFVV